MSKPVRAGRLRHRVDIEDQVSAQDSDGAQSFEWLTVASNIPADIVDLTGRELFAAQAVQSKTTVRIKLRFWAGLTDRMRIVHRDTVYNIEGIVHDPDSRIRYMTLQCSAGTNEGG